MQNNLITSAEVIQELINLGKDIKEADRKGEDLGLDFREFAFYSALEVNDSAVSILGDDILRHIARELVDTVRSNSSIDWTVRENVQAKMRITIKKNPPQTWLPTRPRTQSHRNCFGAS